MRIEGRRYIDSGPRADHVDGYEPSGGLIEATGICRDGKAGRIRKHPSFADQVDADLGVEELGTVTVDTAYDAVAPQRGADPARQDRPWHRSRHDGRRPAIVPVISGRAWITGTSQLVPSPADPWPTGHRPTDT